MTNDTTITAYDFADSAPEWARPLATCWNWAHNFPDFAPMRMLLDLTGYSDVELGEPLNDWSARRSLGAYDLAVLADALNAWTERPTDAADWVRQLLALEAGEDA